MNRPSRGARASATTNRYVGCFLAPMRRSRIFTMLCFLSVGLAKIAGGSAAYASFVRRPSVSSSRRDCSNCLTSRLTSETCVPEPMRDALAARAVEQIGVAAFAQRHRADDRFDARQIFFGNLEVFGQRAREAGNHLHDVAHRADLAHLTHLVEKVVEREALLEQLFFERFGLLGRVEICVFSMSVSTSPMPRMRDASRSG